MSRLSNEERSYYCKMARNSKTSLETLYNLSDMDDSWILSNIAMNPKCPPDLLDWLSWSPLPQVDEWVARNPNTPSETKERLKMRSSFLKNITDSHETTQNALKKGIIIDPSELCTTNDEQDNYENDLEDDLSMSM